MSTKGYIIIYLVIIIYSALCLSIKYLSNFLGLLLINKKIIKTNCLNLNHRFCLKSWFFEVIADFIAIIVNITVGKTLVLDSSLYFTILGIFISLIISFIFIYFLILKNKYITIFKRIISSIILSLLTVPYYLHISLAYTYVL